MKIEIEINEEEVLRLVVGAGRGALTEVVADEFRRLGIEKVVKEIKNLYLSNSSTFSEPDKDRLTFEVNNQILNKISGAIDSIIKERLTGERLSFIIDGAVARNMNKWIEQEVHNKLAEVKADIGFYSNKELKDEDEEREARHAEEIKELKNT